MAPGRCHHALAQRPGSGKLAERYGLLVLTWSRGGVDTYVVQDESTTYRYRAGGPAPAVDLEQDVPVDVRA